MANSALGLDLGDGCVAGTMSGTVSPPLFGKAVNNRLDCLHLGHVDQFLGLETAIFGKMPDGLTDKLGPDLVKFSGLLDLLLIHDGVFHVAQMSVFGRTLLAQAIEDRELAWVTGRSRRASRMPRPYPNSAKRENFCGGWDFHKAQPGPGVPDRAGKRKRADQPKAKAQTSPQGQGAIASQGDAYL